MFSEDEAMLSVRHSNEIFIDMMTHLYNPYYIIMRAHTKKCALMNGHRLAKTYRPTRTHTHTHTHCNTHIHCDTHIQIYKYTHTYTYTC